MANIGQMRANIGFCHANGRHIRRSTGKALDDFLIGDDAGNLIIKLAVEPAKKTAHLDAAFNIRGQQAALAKAKAPALIKIFSDIFCTANGEFRIIKHHRRFTRRVDEQEFPSPFPGFFLDQFKAQAHFRAYKADKSGKRTKWMMNECGHQHAKQI
jgi:hypothetical protein